MKPRNKKFEYGRGAKGQFYWRLKAGNGEIIAEGEGYHGEADCLHVFSLLCSVTSDTCSVLRKSKPKNTSRLDNLTRYISVY